MTCCVDTKTGSLKLVSKCLTYCECCSSKQEPVYAQFFGKTRQGPEMAVCVDCAPHVLIPGSARMIEYRNNETLLNPVSERQLFASL